MNRINLITPINKSDHFMLILILALPFSLITGPFLPDLFISLIGLMYIFKNLNNLKNIVYNKISIVFLLFYFFLLVSTFFSYDPLISIENSLFYFRYLFFFWGVYFILEKNPITIKFLIYVFSITFSLVYFDSIIQFFIGTNLTGYPIDQHGGINSFFGTNEDGILGSYIVRLTPIFCALLSYKFCNDTKIKFIISLLIIGSSIVALFSQERTAFALSIIVFISYIYFTDVFSLKIKLYITLMLLFLIFFLLLSNNDIYTRYIISVKDQFFANNQFYIFSTLHQAHYESAIKMFLDKPILGIGPKMFRYYCDYETYYVLNSCSTHPHNNYVQLLAETGIIPFLFILSIFGLMLRIYLKQFINLIGNKNYLYSAHFILMFSSVFISIWPIAPSNSFFNNWINVIYYLPVGFLIYFIKKDNFKINNKNSSLK